MGSGLFCAGDSLGSAVDTTDGLAELPATDLPPALNQVQGQPECDRC